MVLVPESLPFVPGSFKNFFLKSYCSNANTATDTEATKRWLFFPNLTSIKSPDRVIGSVMQCIRVRVNNETCDIKKVSSAHCRHWVPFLLVSLSIAIIIHHLAEQLWTDPGLNGEISACDCELISTKHNTIIPRPPPHPQPQKSAGWEWFIKPSSKTLASREKKKSCHH